ncbi:hypothetical protein GH714_022895 [Hevea brasiliensis]|uniref:Altered inheritance of mitochondria protein 32 n=1 Tax=Hevea brasiliensis TaxID=3981 RepID=A0A6A6KLH3_HEVBR|nr:hypothetical protein GH714_022895 [Hevea brasiliensis]
MASNREGPLSYANNPSSSSSPIAVSDHLDPTFLTADPSGSTSAAPPIASKTTLVFSMKVPVVVMPSSVSLRPSFWIEVRLEMHLGLINRDLGFLTRKTRLTICEGHDGTETSNGDVLIFPDMIRYRRLTHFDVDTFVEEVLVKDGEWLPGTPETLKGFYVFVCSHGSRDRRSGVCGPALLSTFKEEIELRGLRGKVSVSPCSHIGGHKYAGNVIIFGSSINGVINGHWYGYVTPDDVSILLEQHIGKGEIVDWLWRGQMGLSEEEQIKSQEQGLQLNGETDVGKGTNKLTQLQIDEACTAATNSKVEVVKCYQQNGKSSCCQNPALPHEETLDANEKGVKVSPEKKRSSKRILSQINSGKGLSTCKVCTMPTRLESWEHEDTYAALAVAFAVVSVGVAYSCYKQSRVQRVATKAVMINQPPRGDLVCYQGFEVDIIQLSTLRPFNELESPFRPPNFWNSDSIVLAILAPSESDSGISTWTDPCLIGETDSRRAAAVGCNCIPVDGSRDPRRNNCQ